MENTLTTKSFFNPYFLGNKQLNAINVFNSNEILCSFKWLGNNNKYPQVQFEEIKMRNKLDLNKKEVFCFKNELYIHSELCDFQELEEELNYKSETHNHYKTKFSITLNCSHDTPYLNELGKISYKLAPVEKRVINDFFKYRSEETEQGSKLLEIQKKLDKITGKYISASDILKIEAEFNIKF
jgi:hypothetical protein